MAEKAEINKKKGGGQKRLNLAEKYKKGAEKLKKKG